MHIQNYEDAAVTPSDVIVGELFDSMQREVHEETNIPYDLVSKMSMTGVLMWLLSLLFIIEATFPTAGKFSCSAATWT